MLQVSVERALKDVAESGRMLLMPGDFNIPERKRPFTPAELAPYFFVSVATITRMIEDEILIALPMRDKGEPKIPYIAVMHYFLRQQGVMS